MKRPPSLQKTIFVIFSFWVGMMTYGQTGFVSGTIEDADGLPLPGVSIVIKGKNSGAQTDFDGNYRIKCDVDDILVFSYIGSKTREVLVTFSMFGEEQIATVVRKISVETILDSTYQSLVRKNLPAFLLIPNIDESPKTYNASRYLNVSRIKDINTKGDKVNVMYYDSDIYFEVGASSLLSVQFIQKANLPQLQTTFAQGIPLNGINTHLGPETNTIFSYGPKLSGLEFDGGNYPFDTNGNLVALGNGNGRRAVSYNNNPFETVLKNTNTLFFNISTDDNFYGFHFLNKSGENIYGVERNNLNEFTLRFNNSNGYDDLEWDAQVKYVNSTENQPNTNGFRNNLLFNALATPPSFSNSQGISVQDGLQRSFNPENFNNPNWLLSSNRNRLNDQLWVALLYSSLNISDDVALNSKLGYTISDNEQQYGMYKNTVGFFDGYRSDKTLQKDTFDANVTINWNPYFNDLGFDLISSFSYSNENLVYSLFEEIGFDDASFGNPENSSIIQRDISRANFHWFTRLDLEFLDYRAKASFVNNAFASTKQNSKWLLPTLQLRYKLAKDWYTNFIQKLDVSASYGLDISYLNLFYDNQSHNSLQLLPEESFRYTANNDLFASDRVDLEEKKSYELGIDIGFNLFENRWNLNTVYYSNTTKGSVFPIWQNNRYQLQNVANIRNSGIEWTFDTHIYDYNSKFRFTPKLVFSTYNTKVLDLLITEDRIPIAGFSSISKNLIKGKPAGVLVGSKYARDNQGGLIIDAEGFPLVDDDLGIIGSPIPDFNIGFSSTLSWKGFTLDFVFDYQKGGDVWNGTQNVLNYLGTSQQSAIERQTTGFIFEGVNEFGETNTTPVDFANPENGIAGNRFIRYGFEGVAEDALVDGSYFNFKSFNLSYQIESEKKSPFFRQVEFGVYGFNLFTAAKFKGASPYSNLYDQTSSGNLHFFNSPILSEMGVKINFKI